ncbi:MAG: hypothetical protein RBG13Loki_1677 [Promethearchaeota archaeon CR_4]|nr:MAG: hypothetical protein RBG13Loki_1677 [Candidatus Lokiarchaeota archaeon CR_4]
MYLGIIALSPDNVEVQDLHCELTKRKISHDIFSLQHIETRLGESFGLQILSKTGQIISDMDGVFVRGIGSATVPYPKIFFRLDTLYALERLGVVILNTPRSIEYSTDKYFTSMILAQHNIPTPRTIACETFSTAIAAFDNLGGDVVVKPIYGAMGIGIMRLTNRGEAERIFMKLEELNEVFYLQEYVEHQNRDIRVFVLGGQVIASMYRMGKDWRTNIHMGAKPTPIKITPETADLAIKSTEVTTLDVSGVDILETPNGLQVIEVNSIPGWKGIQQVVPIDFPSMIVDYMLGKIKK